MAIIIGHSGAFQSVLQQLHLEGLSVTAVDEISPLHDALMARHPGSEAEAIQEYEKVEQGYITAVRQWEGCVASTISANMPRYEHRAAEAQEQYRTISQELTSLGSVFHNLFPPTRLLRWVAARWHKRVAERRIGLIQNEACAYRRFVEAPLHQWQAILENHRCNRQAFVHQRIYLLERQIRCLQSVMADGGFAGAKAEVEVMDILSKLPDSYYLLNNVNLRADRWMRFQGTVLNKAQIDHLVVGPSGVFVIETKHWSREFASSGRYHNPFQQVARSSHLCYILLKHAGFRVKTRSIIATKGSLPEKPEGSYTKVLRPEELCAYIIWFKEELAPVEARRIAEYLCYKARLRTTPLQ